MAVEVGDWRSPSPDRWSNGIRACSRRLGWDNDRHRDNGLFGMEARHGRRTMHAPLARKLRRQQAEFTALLRGAEKAAG